VSIPLASFFGPKIMIRFLPSDVIAISCCPNLPPPPVSASDDVAEIRGLGFAGGGSSTRHRSDCGMHLQWRCLGSRIEYRNLLDLVSILAAADWDASFTVKRINL
jgi:hypothetical protein